ncbi:hypothetical protein [Neptunicoccus sediminis]|uniref:hypothetical protein n=1 Tax=Neptunicoccus sediminis TaxID=1892596 RepID=UPI000846254A|nr:hypothetical protein [Neptunicoccus sediminis]
MKKLIGAVLLVGMVSSCGLGNSAGNSAGSSAGSSANSAGSASSAGSAGSASSAGSFGNLFGRRNRVDQRVDPVIQNNGGLISVIKEARFERARGGAIIRARGVAPRQGYYDASLYSATGLKPDANGDITLEFRAKEPQFQTNVLGEHSREIDVGIFISNQKLNAANAIRVVGRQNQISLRR